jgi:hypothetical protein
MLIAAMTGAGRGKTDARGFLFRTSDLPVAPVSLLWDRPNREPIRLGPGGFGNCNSGDEAGETGGVKGGRGGKTLGASAAGSAEGSGVIVGGNRRIGATGVREGRTIRAVSRFAIVAAVAACSGLGGSAMRTVSFFGSAISDQLAAKKVAQTEVPCHLQN